MLLINGYFNFTACVLLGRCSEKRATVAASLWVVHVSVTLNSSLLSVVNFLALA